MKELRQQEDEQRRQEQAEEAARRRMEVKRRAELAAANRATDQNLVSAKKVQTLLQSITDIYITQEATIMLSSGVQKHVAALVSSTIRHKERQLRQRDFVVEMTRQPSFVRLSLGPPVLTPLHTEWMLLQRLRLRIQGFDVQEQKQELLSDEVLSSNHLVLHDDTRILSVFDVQSHWQQLLWSANPQLVTAFTADIIHRHWLRLGRFQVMTAKAKTEKQTKKAPVIHQLTQF